MLNRSSVIKLLGLAAVLIAVAFAGFWWLKLHDYNIKVSINAGVEALREAGPLTFFTVMALLPAVGAPLSVFNLTAGTAFTAQLGLAGVLVCVALATAANLALTYWLARYALRPWLEDMISRTKYKIPVVSPAEEKELTLLLRITPGPPFFLQSYLLGLAGVRFWTYMIISLSINMVYASGMVIFGDAILQGKAKVAFFGVSILVAVGLIVHLLRRHYGKKRA